MCIKQVYDFCNYYRVKACNLLLTVSGGGDSTALFHIFTRLQATLKIDRIGIAHINHGLRVAEAEYEKQFVYELARQQGYRFHYRKLSGKKDGDKGIENWARQERYRFFSELKEKYHYHFVATGHTANDQAETIIMRIARGTGIQGLGGIKPIRDDGVIRPLLGLQRKELERWLCLKGKKWCTDSSNFDHSYYRNRIRHTIIPILEQREPRLVATLAELAHHAGKQVAFLTPLINRWLANNVIEEKENKIVIRKSFKEREKFLAIEGLVILFKRHSIPFGKKHLNYFFKEINRQNGQFLLKGGWHFFPGANQVVILQNQTQGSFSRSQFPDQLNLEGSTHCYRSGYRILIKLKEKENSDLHYDSKNRTIYVDAEKTGMQLLFREVRPTDFFQPLGFHTQVRVIDYLKKQHVSRFYRRFTGVVTNNSNKIICIPEVAVGHLFRITKTTKKVFCISFQRL